jgi:DNA invertase Pin-like site-specific DNA recombinase
MRKLYGYARVSTTDQDASLQIDALKAAGCTSIFVDHASGAKSSRPELDRMREQLREGDTVVVWKLDRLGRSLANLIELIKSFEGEKVEFRSLSESMDTTTTGGRLIFNIFASIAEFERALIQERTKAGLEAARARGRVGGRPPKLSDTQVKRIRKLYDSRAITIDEIAATMEVSRPTIYRALKRPVGKMRNPAT